MNYMLDNGWEAPQLPTLPKNTIMTIAIYDQRPIYATNAPTIDWPKLGQGLEKHSSFKFDFEEWKRTPADYINSMLAGWDVKIYEWNSLTRDWNKTW